MRRRSATTPSAFLLLVFLLGAAPQKLMAQTTNVTTGHQDIPAICTGCVYRTGQNLQETTITYSNLLTSTFGQFCNYTTLNGQVYGQPLVVTNVKWGGGQPQTVAYVATMNGSLYAFYGTPPAPSGSPGGCTLLSGTPVSLLLSGETAPTCNNLGGGHCLTIAPNIGILGTPVINTTTLGDGSTGGTIYLVTESVSGSTYHHRLWALDITSLSLTGVTPISITPNGSCPSDSAFSLTHIQRPALLLGGDGYLYISFSMMDGNSSPYPNGLMFAYNTASLSTAPLCLALSQGAQNHDGAGVWGGGGGPAYAQDPDGSWHIFVNTANGVFNLKTGGTDAGDSFIRMSSANTGALSIVDYYTPGDQYFRSNKAPVCVSSGDVDFGSGNPMLIPGGENSDHNYLAVSGDKEGGLWFMDWTNPGG